MCSDQRSRLEATVKPGELWLIEQPSATELRWFDRDALTSADIVIYDRGLTSVVVALLPVAVYAEPLSSNGASPPAVSPRALRFAAEGWRVVQLVEARHGNSQRRHHAADTLIRLNADDLPLLAVAKGAAGRHRLWRGCLRDLAEFIDEIGDDDPLTVILGPPAVPYPARLCAVSGNGLAG